MHFLFHLNDISILEFVNQPIFKSKNEIKTFFMYYLSILDKSFKENCVNCKKTNYILRNLFQSFYPLYSCIRFYKNLVLFLIVQSPVATDKINSK